MATPQPALSPTMPVTRVRGACRDDAVRLAALSRPFVRTGALRERPLALYADRSSEFLVAEGEGGLDGCVALRGFGSEGVLYNFCVAEGSQGSGLGSRLLRAVVVRARVQGFVRVFTATAGSGAVFRRHGFEMVGVGEAPAGWVAELDPRRGSRVLGRGV